jgi:NAD/NADP transhydrogenase beta subunit
MSKVRIVAEYLTFLREQKKWWLLPIVILLLALGVLLVLTKGSALAPFIYALF